MSAVGRHRAPGRTTRLDVDPSAEDDRREPHPAAIQRMYDEAMARAAVHAQLPLQRYLAVLVATT